MSPRLQRLHRHPLHKTSRPPSALLLILPGWELRNPKTGEVLGKKAGPLRNAEMARHADACILFPGGRGTNSMAKEAALAGLRVIDWRVNN